MIKKSFARLGNRIRQLFQTGSVSIGTTITTEMAKLIAEESRFDKLTDAEIYELMYQTEPEIAGAIDKISSLCTRAYRGCYVAVGKQLEEEERKLLEVARKVEQHLNIRRWFEIISGLMLIHGNAFLLVHRSRNALPTLSVLPNKYVTIVDDRDLINQITDKVIQEPRYLVLNEGTLSQNQKIYPYDEIIHIKYKDIPTYVEDKVGRMTFGIYDVSPLRRVKYFSWWKRQVMLIDVMWRWRNVPREHHVLTSDQWDLSKYSGTLEERRKKAEQDAKSSMDQYVTSITEKQPDQAYVTTDTVEIRTIEPRATYLRPNELLEQISEMMLIALGVPESAVTGRARGSYASELIVSSYLTAKIIQMSEKIRDALLEVVREGIRKIDENLPVEKLRMKIELVLETSKMELFRQAAIMVDSGIFTPTEIRRHLGYDELTEADWAEIAMWRGLERQKSREAGSHTIRDVVEDVKKTKIDEPPVDTPRSEEQRRGGG